MSLRGAFVPGTARQGRCATKQSHVMRNNFHQVEIATPPQKQMRAARNDMPKAGYGKNVREQ